MAVLPKTGVMNEQVAQGLHSEVLKEERPAGADALQVLEGSAQCLFGQLAGLADGLLL